MITLKRYSNRKLYNTDSSKYISLTEVGDLIKLGNTVQVIDNSTKLDITKSTLVKVYAEKLTKENIITNETLVELLKK